MDFQYLFIFPFLQEASKKEYKFSFLFSHPTAQNGPKGTNAVGK